MKKLINKLREFGLNHMSRKDAESLIYNTVVKEFDYWISFKDKDSPPYRTSDVYGFCDRIEDIALDEEIRLRSEL